ncbi:uncharacterized protein LOC134764002 isoform X2 [Penaeus indicus]|uniref:uncharacterized protein LOC134764002 isoform X2 n=1 Tax=Penaeus indicus TaxID=29960 RepID=UPI00300D5338
MAPIQMEKSYVKVSSTPAAKCSRQARSSSRSWDVILPIGRRGSFFQDSFFSDIHKDFDSSVREVLARWNDEDLKVKDFRRDDIMDRYRQLRSRNLNEGNQAVTVTSDNESHKIVLDVHDFMCGDVRVKVLDEEELLVEGHVEKKEVGSSSVSSHSFRRYFSLPQHTDMTAITSVMSADGILTVTAPKIKTEMTKENATSQTSASNYEKVSETRKQTASELLSSTRKESCSCDLGFKRKADSSGFDCGSWDTSLPITRRGGFFQDSFFSGTHRDFDASIRKVLNGWNDADHQLADFWDDDDFHRSDRLGRYRQLRSRNLWSNNQAVTVTSDNISYKILVDMHDFVDGDVKVKLMGEKELLVEAQSARSSHTFTRTFSLPESIDITSITSVMSSDGILTITASKKESETQKKTTVIPISVKETHNASEVHSSTSSTTSGVSEETASGQGISHTAQEEERKYARCFQENIDEDKTQTATSNISSNTQQSSQKESSVITDFASTRISDSLGAKKTLGNKQEDSLPITKRGSFFQDSFFSDIRQGFDASVREILKKCNDSDLTVTDDVSHSDILSRYRQLRSRDMREEDQAFSVTSDSASLKIVLDVYDFMRGDVKVKVVDEKELVVEGRVEKEEGSSSVSSHSFRRRFSLPHRTNMTHITSVMSSDGILTITAPKTAGEPQQNTHINFSMTEERKESTTVQDLKPKALSSTKDKNISVHENLVNVDQKDFECEQKHMYENKMRKLEKEFEFPAESKEVLKPKICQNQSVDKSTTASVHEHGNAANNQDHELKRLTETFKSTITEKASCDDFISEEQTSMQSESESTEAIKLREDILPITRRGSFVQDSFFLDVHQEFYTAIREVLKKWVSADSEDFLSLSHSDILNHYRQLRSRDLREETQVSIVTSDNTSYKIVLDIQDFMNRDLKVKVVGETKVVVEGSVAKREGSSSVSSYSFRRCFSLPEYIDITTITCIMSSDGILTIITSKMPEESEEYKVVSSIEEVQESSEVQRSVSPTNETISLHEECEKASKATYDCMDSMAEDTSIEFEDVKTPLSEEMCHSVKSETAQQFLLSTDSAATSSHDTDFGIVETEAMADDSASVSYSESAEITEASLCRRSSIGLNETFGDNSESRDFGTSHDSLPSVIPEEENESETVEVLHLEDSQQAIEILDLHDSQESVSILDAKDSAVEILDLKDSQESADILQVKGSEAVEIVDLTDLQESVDILDTKGSAVENLDLKNSHESVDILDVQDLQESADIVEVKGTAIEILDLTDSQESVDILDAKVSAVENLDLESSHESVDILDVQDLQESADIVEVKGTAVEILGLTDSQQSVDIRDVKDSHESINILEVKGSEVVEISDLKDSQESTEILHQKDSEEAAEIFDLMDSEAVEILDLKDSQEAVGILYVKDSQEAVAEAQNTSETQNSTSSSTSDEVTEDAVPVQERSKPVSEETLDSKMNRLAVTESCTDSLQSSGDSCTSEKEVVDTLGQLKLKEMTETVRTEESTETGESLKGMRSVHRDSPEEFLLITKRGNFFQDSFFLDTQRDFSAALRQVLGRCNEENFENDINLCYTDILERYRQLRSRDLKEENQAVIVTSDKSCLKIIMDVYEFMSGDIQAKVVDEKELVIEGRVVKSEGTSFETSHSFRHRFSLPQYTDITSVMSLDGILTVTVIFKEGNVELNTTKKTEAKCNITKEIIDSKSPSLSAEKHVLEAKAENQDRLNKNVTLQSEETRNFTSGTERSKLDSNFEDNRLRRYGRGYNRESEENNRYNVTEDTSMGTSSRFTSVSQCSSALKSFPVTRKGLFFSDYFFRDTREDFQKAVREILNKWGEKSSSGDEMTCYRKLRARNMREDNQAVTSSEDERHYKFVIDVQDFMDVGEISVKAVNERELVVEGHLEKKEDGSKSSKRFLRRFVVPGDIELEAVMSAMSSDGVLKILAPKRLGHNRKHVSTDMDDGDAMFSRKFTNGHRLADDFLGNRDSSSDNRDFKAFARKVNDRYQVGFQDDDEHFENGHMLNNETKMKTDKDFKFDIPSFSTENRVLHVDRRGVFTEDYFFANVRDSFSQAVREVLEKANEWTCRSDAMHNYRRLRQRNLKLETQAVGIIDDQDSHKIVMDVFDFIKGDVTVQLVKGKELLVEGQAEKQDGSRVSRVSFVRRLALPELVDRDAISCVLSSDGILTVISKKRACEYRTSARGLSSERKSYGDRAGRWEDKKVKDSLANVEGPSSRSFSTGSRSRYHRSYAKQY